MGFLWHYLRRYKKLLTITVILAAINQVFSLLDPQIFRLIVDNYATRAHEIASSDFIRGVLLLLAASVGVAFVSRVAKSFQDYYMNVITQRLGTAMYASSVQHSLSLPYAAFEDQRSGELLEKLQKARTDTQELISVLVNVLLLSAVGVVFVLVYASIVHWGVGLAYIVSIPTIGAITYTISRGIKKIQQKVVQETAALAGSTTETIRNVELVKSLGLEAQEVQRLNDVNERILQLEIRKIVLIRRLSFIQGTVVNAVRSAILFLMLWLIAQGAMTIGEFFSLLIYSFFVFSPLAELGTVASKYQEAKGSMEQLNEILQMQPEQKPAQPAVLNTVRSVQFSNVRFQHRTAHMHAVDGVSFTIRERETVAFVGPSGSGKTTIVKLLVGLYQPSEGSITFNGTVPSTTIDYDAVRKHIGFVGQETQLFAGTIRENLLFVHPRASDQDCYRVLEAAAANTILQRGARGLDTKIGEGGLKLSGGERQRLAIARALLRDPSLIIFDEATSSLDSLTEASITQTIRSLDRSQSSLTTVLIAHRLSTVVYADHIYVMEHGKIAEQGTHQELLQNGGLYAALWRQQIAAEPAGA